MKNINIRRAESSDLEDVYKIICELEDEQLDFGKFSLIYARNIINPDYVYLVAELNGEAIGYISLHSQNLLHHCGRVAEIQEFFIHRDFRNRGIGKMLINEITLISLDKAIRFIEVTSNKKRIENVKVYERLGFSLSHNKFTKVLKLSSDNV